VDYLGQKVTAHCFRHTYATLMAEAIGQNPFVLKEILGHKRLTSSPSSRN
jgi:integrase